MANSEAMFCRSAAWRWIARRMVLPWVLGDTSVTGRVLEIGGGSGERADALARTHRIVDVTVSDIDPAMVADAKRRARSARVHADVADVTALHYNDASFDVALSFLMLHHVVDVEPAISE